ncbi:MAG: DUF4332 domain-containing protein, partial [Pseudomonadota bacterium]
LPFRILYAAHANGTHHKLAMDALLELSGDDGEAWRRMFLAHAKLYLEGSKAPDKEFKDFKNHVLHPGDDFWGGAPEKVRNWYQHTVTALSEKNWSEAAYCAGVMSHYVTDPIQPFHTAQSKAENAIHRAAEWSISKSYGGLRRDALRRLPIETPTLPDGDAWIEDFVCQCAERSHEDYERLIAHYDITAGSVTPEDGYDTVGRNAIGVLLLYATSAHAQLLQRAITEAGVTPPRVQLTAASILAGLQMPLKWVLRKMEDAQEKAAVQAMYDELKLTGDVDETLPEDDRAVRDLHAREVLAKRHDQRAKARLRRVQSARDTRRRAEANGGGLSAVANPGEASKTAAAHERSRSMTAFGSIAPSQVQAQAQAQAATPKSPVSGKPETLAKLQPRGEQPQVRQQQSTNISVSDSVPASEHPAPRPAMQKVVAPHVAAVDQPDVSETRRNKPVRFFLERDSDIVDAPSIGPKTAGRLRPHGLLTVGDLLDCDAEHIARAVGVRHITASSIADWRTQSLLVMTIPELRGTHAQLLVGAGYTSPTDIALASPDDVCAKVLHFAQSTDGKRLLRDGAAPDIEKIKMWTENAQFARAAA